jgi:hypothetical protein
MIDEMYLVKNRNLFGRLVRVKEDPYKGCWMADIWRINDGFGKRRRRLGCLGAEYFCESQVDKAVNLLEQQLGRKGAWLKYKSPQQIADELSSVGDTPKSIEEYQAEIEEEGEHHESH